MLLAPTITMHQPNSSYAVSVARQETQRLSLMPEGLLANLTARDAADLLEFLSSLK